MAQQDVLVYWRRIGNPAFPAEDINDVEVLTPTEYEAQYGGSPKVGEHDGGWRAVTGEAKDIDDRLGLCGNLSELFAICDAMLISAAIHQHLGLKPMPWDEDCMWTNKQLDGHDKEDAGYYFRTIGKVYGADVEAAARRKYGKD